MQFLFYFRASVYVFIGSGFLALLVTEYYGLLSLLVFAAILFTGWRLDSGSWQLQLARWWWNLATLAFLLFCIADALFLRRITSVALVNFLIFLQVTKLFNPKQPRDYALIYVISFFELLITSIMTLSILFAFSCILFAITGTWALITLHLKQEIGTHVLPQDASPSSGNPEQTLDQEEARFSTPAINSLLNARFFMSTLGITLLTFVLTAITFVILPRVREGFFFQYGNPLGANVSGFSEEVDLGTFGTIRLDYTPVMQVMLPEITSLSELPQRLYWKGLSFDWYDGRRWKSSATRKKLLSSRQERIWFSRPPDTTTLLRQDIELRSAQYSVVFAAHKLHAAEGRLLSLQYAPKTGNTDVIFDPYSPKYSAYSDVSVPAEALLRRDHQRYPEDIRELYLQLPDLADRVTDLAQEAGATAANAYEQAVAVQDFLLRNYAYSLSVERSPDLSPLEDFLFVNKAGHCEFYATSMVIFLRILGVPARMVNGFARGYWNEYGNFFTVRQSDAHSWVEVFFPSHGWVIFDPTPPVAFGEEYQQFAEQQSLAARLYRYSEYIRTRWNRYIIDYSVQDQARLVVGAFLKSRSARRSLRSTIRSLRQRIDRIKQAVSWQDLALTLGGILSLLLLLRLLARRVFRIHIRIPGLRFRFKTRRKRPRNRRIRFYATMLRILSRRGIRKDDSLTPREFASTVARHHPSYADDVQALTSLYYAARFGHAELSDTHINEIDQMLNRLKHWKK